MPLDKNTSRNIHLLTVSNEQKEFKLGRGHESQVRINDISVSRCHAIIKCKDDGFYIEDNTSKFGTIVLLKDKLRLKALHTMAVQVGRTVISFTIKYVQSEKEKLKSDINKVLDSKNKSLKAVKPSGPDINEQPGQTANSYNASFPLHLQATGFQAGNVLMRDDGQAEQVEDDNDEEPGDMDDR